VNVAVGAVRGDQASPTRVPGGGL